jgi:hypothetical protein
MIVIFSIICVFSLAIGGYLVFKGTKKEDK